jgi:geranylgeranyl pyrophosphate synthase
MITKLARIYALIEEELSAFFLHIFQHLQSAPLPCKQKGFHLFNRKGKRCLPVLLITKVQIKFHNNSNKSGLILSAVIQKKSKHQIRYLFTFEMFSGEPEKKSIFFV